MRSSRRYLPPLAVAVAVLQSVGLTAAVGPATAEPADAVTGRSAGALVGSVLGSLADPSVVAAVGSVAGPLAGVAVSGRCPTSGGRYVATAAATGSGIVVQGHGWGHGLGMSQYGAQGAARLGCTHAQILSTYYAGTRLARSPMTAPVQLKLHGAARRSTVSTESAAVRWTAAGRTFTQPARTTWTVTTSAGRTTLTSSTGARLAQVAAGGTLQVGHVGAVVRLRSFTGSSTTAAADLRLRWGTLTFTASTSAAGVTETITGDSRASAVDRYLWGLGEVPVSWPQEALRAQADAARTYLAHTYDSRTRRYVIGVTTAAQVYRGAAQEDTDARYGSPWRSAVTATHDEVVVDARGRLIWALYFSSGGGRAESRAYVYGSQASYGYLVGVDDSRWDLASDNPLRSWARVFTPADFARRLGFSSVRAVAIGAPGTAGRGNGLVVTGVRSGATVTVRFTGDQVRGALGLPSPVISVSWTAGRTPTGGTGSTPPTSAPATRTTASYTSSVCNGTACGSATARFTGTGALTDVRESVQDTTCNGRRAQVRLQVRYTDGSSQLTPARPAATRCRPPATAYSGLTWRSSRPIAGFAVVVGESGGRTVTGRYVDNPNT